jgi:hypothetical protein
MSRSSSVAIAGVMCLILFSSVFSGDVAAQEANPVQPEATPPVPPQAPASPFPLPRFTYPTPPNTTTYTWPPGTGLQLRPGQRSPGATPLASVCYTMRIVPADPSIDPKIVAGPSASGMEFTMRIAPAAKCVVPGIPVP